MAAPLTIETVHFDGAKAGEVLGEIKATRIGLAMRFSVVLPALAVAGERVPALICLAGLSSGEATFMTKAGAQRRTAQWGDLFADACRSVILSTSHSRSVAMPVTIMATTLFPPSSTIISIIMRRF